MTEKPRQGSYPKGAVFLAFVLLVVLGAYTYTYAYPLPFGDHWDEIRFLAEADKGNFRWLFGIGGGHFHTTGYALNYLLNVSIGFNPLVQCLISVFIAGFTLLLAIPLAVRVVGSQARAAVGASLAVFLILSLDQASNWLWGWQTAVFIAIFGYILFTYSATADVLRWRYLVGMTVGALLAIYAFATAFALLPIGLIILGYRAFGPTERPRVSPLKFLFWLAFCFAVIVHYVLALQATPRGDGGAYETLADTDLIELITHVILYVIVFLGAGISGGNDSSTFIAVLVGAVCLVFAVQQSIKRGDTVDDLMPALTLMAIGAGAACLAALGRVEFGYTQALVSRYVSFSNLFWLGAGLWLFRVFPSPKSLLTHRTNWSIIASFCLGTLMVAKVENTIRGATSGITLSTEIAAESALLVETYPEISAETLIALGRTNPASHDRIREDITYLHEHGWPPFHKKQDAKHTAPSEN